MYCPGTVCELEVGGVDGWAVEKDGPGFQSRITIYWLFELRSVTSLSLFPCMCFAFSRLPGTGERRVKVSWSSLSVSSFEPHLLVNYSCSSQCRSTGCSHTIVPGQSQASKAEAAARELWHQREEGNERAKEKGGAQAARSERSKMRWREQVRGRAHRRWETWEGWPAVSFTDSVAGGPVLCVSAPESYLSQTWS